MAYIACLIQFLLTVVIPLKLTYDSVFKHQKDIKVWAIYWLVYHMIASLQWLVPFLSKYD